MGVFRSRVSSSGFVQDLVLAGRSLRRAPVSTALAVLTLGLGIGGSTAFFGLLDAAFVRPLPFPETRRLMRLLVAVPTGDGGSYLANLTPRQVLFLEQRARSFDRITCQRYESFALIGAGDPVQLGGASLSLGSAELLGLRPVIGRGFDAREQALGQQSGAVIISHSLWVDRFGSDPGTIGRTLRLGDRTASVIGVAQPAFHFPYRADVWQPLRLDPRDGRDLLVIARLRPGATAKAARGEMAALANEFRREAGGAASRSTLPIRVVPLRQELLRDQERTAVGLFLATLLFLLMACANVAGLLVARTSLRHREIAIRSVLGAGRWALVRGVVAEPILLAAAGGALALGVLRVVAPMLQSLVPQVLAQELGVEPVRLSWRVAGFCLAASVAAIVIACLGPAVPALRVAGDAALGMERTPHLGGRPRGLRALVVSEIGVLSLLLVATTALVGGFLAASRTPLGFDPGGVWALHVVAPASRYGDPAGLARLVERIADESLSVPGAHVAVTTINPLGGATWGDSVRRAGTPPEQASAVNLRLVSPGLFDTLRLPLVSGRDFTPADARGAPVAIVSRRLAERLWHRDAVVGETLVRGPATAPVATRVVGVASDVLDAGDLRETIYLPFAQQAGLADANQFWVLARSDAGSASWVRELERGIWRIDPDLAWSDAGWEKVLRSQSLERGRLGSRLAALYAGFGLLLAGLGLAGVMAFLLGQREVELGVRQALGATRGVLLRALTTEGLALAGVGLAVGFGAFFVASPALAHWVPDVARPGPAVLALVAGVILAVSGLASYLPARRAAARDPMAALREG
jgi:putative ABC transport system permease protein